MAADVPREPTHPLIWTAGLVGFVAFVAWWFAYMMDRGRHHALDNPLPPTEDAAGPVVPDHALYIQRMKAGDQELLALGKQVYAQTCTLCHGDQGGAPKPGFNARNFLEEPMVKEGGATPYGMYLTVQEGYGQMPAQPVEPEATYAAIHYIREAFLKPSNPSQYFEITDEYLAESPWPEPGQGGAEAADAGPVEPWYVRRREPLDIPIAGAMDLIAERAEERAAARARLRRAAAELPEPIGAALERAAGDPEVAPLAAELVAAAERDDPERFLALLGAPVRDELQAGLALLGERELASVLAAIRDADATGGRR